MNMRKRTFILTATLILGASNCPSFVYAADDNISVLRTVYEQNSNSEQAIYDYALALARSGQFPLALELFQQISKSTTNSNILYDYAVVLTWAGDYPKAILLYENQIRNLKTSLPSYSKNSIAGAYYHVGKFNEATKLFHEVAASGDRQAKRWEAESSMRMNDIAAANKLYDELLAQDPNDTDTYLSRASILIVVGDNISAAVNVDKALSLLPETKEGNEKRHQIRSNIAVSFIQNGDYSRGIVLLKPVIADGSSDMKMQANYIFALRVNGDYKAAIREATRLWTEYEKVPDFGLQALADSYLRTQQPIKAVPIYNIILKRSNKNTNLNTIKRSLGYAYLKAGNLKQGLSLYKEVISANPELGIGAAQDASSFIENNEFYTGKQLYETLLHRFPNNELYRKEYALSLSRKDMPREAYEQYKVLSKLKNGTLIGLAGIVNTSVNFGDYQTASLAVNSLDENCSVQPIYGQAVKKYENRAQGNVEPRFEILHDYKGNDIKTTELTASSHLDGRFSILAYFNKKTISDGNNSATLRSSSLGLQYQDVIRDATIWLDNYKVNNNFSSYHFSTNHYFDDMSFIKVKVERAPVEDVEALITPIMATNYQISFNRQLSLKDLYTLAFTSSVYSDGNHSTAYKTAFKHVVVSTKKKNINWFTNFSRLNYKYQEINGNITPYESPTVRESYGLGIKERWIGLKDYWEATFTTVWDRDRPEAFGFSHSIGLEYAYNFSKNQSLVVGAEYGFHTDKLSGSRSLGFGFRQYHMNYTITW